MRGGLLSLTLLGLTIWASSLIAGNDKPPSPLTAHDAIYSLSRSGMVFGETTAKLRAYDNDYYSYETYSKASALFRFFISDRITERTHWSVVDGQIRPVSYLFDRSGGKKEKSIKLSFNWSALKVKNDISGDVW